MYLNSRPQPSCETLPVIFMTRHLYKLIFLITIVTLLLSCDRKSKSAYSENEIRIYEDSAASFIKWLIKNDSSTLFMRVLNVNNPNTIEYNKILSPNIAEYSRPLYMISYIKIKENSLFFTPVDTNFIYEIFRNKINNNIIDTNINMEGVTILNRNHSTHTQKKVDSYSQISTPIFNSNYNLVIIEINKFCYPECGYGIECIYQKSDKGWIKVKQIDTWIN